MQKLPVRHSDIDRAEPLFHGAKLDFRPTKGVSFGVHGHLFATADQANNQSLGQELDAILGAELFEGIRLSAGGAALCSPSGTDWWSFLMLDGQIRRQFDGR